MKVYPHVGFLRDKFWFCVSRVPYGFSLTPSALLSRGMRRSVLFLPCYFITFAIYGLTNSEVRSFLKRVRIIQSPAFKFNAQNLQDVAAEVYTQNAQKLYVDLGAAYPIKYSNTFFLQQKGWIGLLVEANPIFWDELTTRVNKSTKLHKGAVGVKKEVKKLLNAGPLSSIVGFENVDNYGHLRKSLSKRDGIVSTQMSPVAELLQMVGANKNFGYLSIDIEGLDLIILEECLKSGFRPEFITIEHNYVKENIVGICDIASRYNYKIKCYQISAQDFWLKKE